MQDAEAGEDGGVPVLDFSIDVSVPEDGIKKVFQLLRPDLAVNNDMNLKELSGGLVNVMFLVSSKARPEDKMIVRIHKPFMQDIFDRDQEFLFIQFLHTRGLYGKIYARFLNGMCYLFTPGRTLTIEDLRDPDISRKVARKLAEIHAASLSLVLDEKRTLVDFTRRFFTIICAPDFKCVDPAAEKVIKYELPDRHVIRAEFERLVCDLEVLRSPHLPLVLCHLDIVSGNLIYDDKHPNGTIHVIDFEFAGAGYQAEDIGNHLSEFVGCDPLNMDFARYPTEEFQLDWITHYLEAWNEYTTQSQVVTKDQVWNLYVRSNKLVLIKYLFVFAYNITVEARNPDYLANIKSLGGFDALSYVTENLRGYELRKEAVSQLELRPE